VDTPTSIAKALHVEPPAVIDQLHKLRKIRVVRLGQKTGKEQHYVIDWEKLAEESFHRTVAPRYKPAFGIIHAKSFVKKFSKFQVFLRTYFETILSAYYRGEDDAKYGMQHNPTFSDWLEALHSNLLSMGYDYLFTTEGFGLIDEPSLRPFSDSLRNWIMKSQPIDPHAGTFLFNTLHKLGFKTREDVIRR
jgi:hypothetical protein